MNSKMSTAMIIFIALISTASATCPTDLTPCDPVSLGRNITTCACICETTLCPITFNVTMTFNPQTCGCDCPVDSSCSLPSVITDSCTCECNDLFLNCFWGQPTPYSLAITIIAAAVAVFLAYIILKTILAMIKCICCESD